MNIESFFNLIENTILFTHFTAMDIMGTKKMEIGKDHF